MIQKLLIANRGEIALRVIAACRDLGVPTVAVYSQADRGALHVRHADEALCIGPARSTDSYLNVPAVISAAEITDTGGQTTVDRSFEVMIAVLRRGLAATSARGEP